MANYQPRVVRGRIEVWVPHKDGEIAFAFPSAGPKTYRGIGKHILEANQNLPTGDYTASLLHSAYGCTPEAQGVMDESEFANVREVMKNRWLWVFNQDLWTPQGVYVVQDLNADGRNKQLNSAELEKKLKGGKELSWGGIRFSEDRSVRFAPKDSYRFGLHTPDSLARDGFIIASCDEDGAKKLGETSSKFRNNPQTYGVKVQEGNTPGQRVSAVDDFVCGLRFVGGDWGGGGGRAFGVLK